MLLSSLFLAVVRRSRKADAVRVLWRSQESSTAEVYLFLRTIRSSKQAVTRRFDWSPLNAAGAERPVAQLSRWAM